MSLIKSMRKYSNKIMVFLLIFIMVGFVLGASIRPIINQFNRWFSSGQSAAVYGNNVKINHLDIQTAQNELSILKGLMADRFLMATDRQGNPNNKNLILLQVLFPDTKMAAYFSNQIKRDAISNKQGSLLATSKDIDAFFNQIEGRSDITWMLLKSEARDAGIVISDAQTRSTLKQIIPYFTGGGGDAAVMVGNLSNQYRIPQGDVVTVFSDFLAVITYASNILKSEDVTIDQVQSLIGLGGEKINAEMIKFQTGAKGAELPEPTAQEIAAQFDKYKDIAPGVYTKENPYAFGYKQPATAVIEYMIIKTEDVQKTVDTPTSQEMEDYYQNNRQAYTSSRLVDPNKPDGEKISETKDYSDVASQIRVTLTSQNTEAKADMIMIDAIDMLDKGYSTIDMQKADSELYKLHSKDYTVVGEAIAKKHNIKVYTGKSGKLSTEGIIKDRILGSMNLQSSRGMSRITLDKLVFAIDELGEKELSRFDPPKPSMWQNIGPAKSSYGATVVLARVVEANQSYTPESIELVYDTKGTVTDETIILSENMYNLKESIIEDLKKVASVKVAKEQAEKFVRLLKDKEWEDAIKEFNKDLDEKDPIVRPLSLNKQREKTRTSLFNKKNTEIRAEGMNHLMAQYMSTMAATDELMQGKLYSLIEAGQTEATNVRAILESAPEQACFVVKDVSKSNVTIDDYEKSKVMAAFSLDLTRSDSLALIHFAPDNITERMGFKWNEKEKSDDDEDEDGKEDGNDDTDKDGDS
jgi:hypothetical protein